MPTEDALKKKDAQYLLEGGKKKIDAVSCGIRGHSAQGLVR